MLAQVLSFPCAYGPRNARRVRTLTVAWCTFLLPCHGQANDGSAYAIDMGTQAMVLRACVLAGEQSPIPMLLLNKLANYVSQGGNG